MRHLHLDLETLPTADPELIAELTADIRPPGNYKKPETILEWELNERPKIVAEAIAKTALDGAYGRICCIGWAIDDQEPQAIVSADERELLMTFYAAVDEVLTPHDGTGDVWRIVNHYLTSFDLPFLYKRSVIQQIEPPRMLLRAMRAKPWDECITDTALMWTGDRTKHISLDRLCKVLGIPSPKADGMDGSQVAQAFAEGRYEEIGSYCCGDVEAARRCYKAMVFE